MQISQKSRVIVPSIASAPAFGCYRTQRTSFGCDPVSGGFMAVHGGHVLIGVAAGVLTAVAASAVVFRDKIGAFFSGKQG